MVKCLWLSLLFLADNADTTKQNFKGLRKVIYYKDDDISKTKKDKWDSWHETYRKENPLFEAWDV